MVNVPLEHPLLYFELLDGTFIIYPSNCRLDDAVPVFAGFSPAAFTPCRWELRKYIRPMVLLEVPHSKETAVLWIGGDQPFFGAPVDSHPSL